MLKSYQMRLEKKTRKGNGKSTIRRQEESWTEAIGQRQTQHRPQSKKDEKHGPYKKKERNKREVKKKYRRWKKEKSLLKRHNLSSVEKWKVRSGQRPYNLCKRWFLPRNNHCFLPRAADLLFLHLFLS